MPEVPSTPIADDVVETYRPLIEGHDLLLYDGVCALCNGVVRYLLRHDRRARFRFIPQQTRLAEEILRRFAQQSEPAEGVILVTAALTPGTRIYRRSDAVGQALLLLGGAPSWFGRMSRIIPRALREALYGLVARYRYRWFGRYATCPVPSPEQRSRILGLDS
jgi:predicted DCC family thiol-disulfide oxidoreductase YuxK